MCKQSVGELLKPVQPAFTRQFIMLSMAVTSVAAQLAIIPRIHWKFPRTSLPQGLQSLDLEVSRINSPAKDSELTAHYPYNNSVSVCYRIPFASLSLAVTPSVIQLPSQLHSPLPIAISNLAHKLCCQIITLVNSFLCVLVSAFGSTPWRTFGSWDCVCYTLLCDLITMQWFLSLETVLINLLLSTQRYSALEWFFFLFSFLQTFVLPRK